MAIATVITRGYGNGTFNGTVGLVVTRGYTIGAVTIGPTVAGPVSVLVSLSRATNSLGLVAGANKALAENTKNSVNTY